MARRTAWAALACALICGMATTAQGRPFKYHYVLSCGDYLAQSPMAYQRQYAVSFVRGYVTAYNAYNQRHQITQEIDLASFDAYIDKFCREHPLQDSGAAAFALVKEMGGTAPPND